MPKATNTAGSAVVRVTISTQSAQLLSALASKGIYGRNPAEVAGRFIDEALQKFVKTPRLPLAPDRGRRTYR